MKNSSRRSFLRALAIGSSVMAMPNMLLRLSAQEAKGEGEAKPAGPALVVLYLRGGADALNIVVPYADPRYAKLRPTIAIPAEGENALLKLDDRFGLHPALKSLQPWYAKKRLAPIVCVGSHHSTRSHFDAQDFMEYAAPGDRTIRNGWLNRYLQASRGEDAKLRGVAMQGLLPRALRGDYSVLAVPDRKVTQDGELLELFEDLYEDEPGMEKRDDEVREKGKATVETLKEYRGILARGIGKRATFPDSAPGAQLKDVAQLLRANVGLQVACIDVKGWDDHVNEGGATGAMATRLKSLADSMAAFAEDIGDRIDNTLVMVMTEFGRTCRENGNEGTDHGHGGFMFLLGGGVQGGKVHGEWKGLEDGALYQKRDLPVHTDFRDVFAQVLQSHMQFKAPESYFHGFSPAGVPALFKA
ncbi:MAG: DUF1501 domain-containing protein [Planctomycetes bacterium]|nr:DUF1501 domain-containing protein [Planctomycetota bacterium]